ncbi:MAG: DUF4956 domain-containing protein [Lachnospiraceae bacterium]|nr:DUF4956 domain-containing protein [Lachnospiraceae bacterium]
MSFTDVFKDGFLKSYANNEITFRYAVLSMIVCLVISIIICLVYYFKSRKYFYSKEFAVSLAVLCIITDAIILTIQSSIVVSLGMVGALSIVRFRTAIKNPLDLVFLFWSISIGIICGAGIYYIAIPLTLIVGIVILVSDEIPGKASNKLLVLDGRYPYDTEVLKEILHKNVRYWNIKTKSIHNDDVNLVIEIRGIKDQEKLLSDIKKTGSFHNISIILQEGIID